jgi:hypothetical protein
MSYTYTAHPNQVERDEDKAIIPEDMGNIDWVAYQDWLAEGNVTNPYVPPPPTRQQEIDAYMAQGLTINATNSTMGSGRFGVVPPYSDIVNSNATYFNSNTNFPGGLPYAEIVDLDGTYHSIPGSKHNTDWARFVADIGTFVHQCHLYAAGFVDVLPPNVVDL